MERYTRLYSLPENLYTQGSPVIIAAGALLLDNQTGRVMAQLKFQNLSPKDIKAVIVSVDAFDVTGKNVEGIAEYQYLDLGASAQRDAYFGQKQAIALPAATTRSFTPHCTGVVFADGTAWEAPRKAEEAAALAAKRRKAGKTAAIVAAAACVCIAAFLLVTKVIIPNKNYNAAVTLMEAGQYEEAITAFDAMDGYKDSAEQITECGYLHAVALMEAGQYEEAITAFEAMDGYKDSADQIEACKQASLQARLYEAEVGDYVYFGSYEQDNDTSNGKEDIEWLVLAKEDNKILVISKYALDCQPYNTDLESVTWETCTLRDWLNEAFINEAFSSAEKSMILETTVTADKNPSYSTDPGNDTTDKIFLLSIDEANEYFDSDAKRMCAPTAYAKAHGAYTNDSYKVDGKATCWWFLRSPGDDQNDAANVYYDGGVYDYGSSVDYADVCVRPAFWINLES